MHKDEVSSSNKSIQRNVNTNDLNKELNSNSVNNYETIGMTCNINYDKLLSESYEVYQELNDDHDHQIDSRHQFNSIASKTKLNMVEFDI